MSSAVIRGDVHAVSAPRDRGLLQHGQRYAVIVQSSDLAPLSTVVGCPTSRSARATRFRPEIRVLDEPTRVLCEQVGALDATWVGERIGHLTLEEQHAVDEALRLVLDL